MEFIEILLLSLFMGLSIFLSYPIIYLKNKGIDRIFIINAFAIGLLIFLIADIFSDASSTIYNDTLYGYGSSPLPDAIFGLSLLGGFLLFFFVGKSKIKRGNTIITPLIIALAIGFQNLTEGFVFGSLGSSIGFSGVVEVILVGFTVQNITEGFPITSSFINSGNDSKTSLFLLFTLGGLPAAIGGISGFFFFSKYFVLFFDGLAVGSILYVVIPMLTNVLESRSVKGFNSFYMALMTGFFTGFLVNLV